MKAEKLWRRWERRRARLARSLQKLSSECLAEGSAEQVHDIRVTLRRLRLIVRPAKPILPSKTLALLREWSRTITDSAGEIRDLDVAIEWVKQQKDTESLCAELGEERQQHWLRWRQQARVMPARLVKALEHASGGASQSARLKARLTRLDEKLQSKIKKEISHFFKLPLVAQHEFRRTLRWWRYLRELYLPRRRQKTDAVLRNILRTQESIGDAQNLTVTATLLSRRATSEQILRLRQLLTRESSGKGAKTRASFRALRAAAGWSKKRGKGSGKPSKIKPVPGVEAKA